MLRQWLRLIRCQEGGRKKRIHRARASARKYTGNWQKSNGDSLQPREYNPPGTGDSLV